MSCISGPNNNTNGLVFEYDMANFKSYKGPTITNLIPSLNCLNTSGTGYSFIKSVDNVNIPSLGNMDVISCNIQNDYPTTSSWCCPNVFQYSNVACNSSTLYTYAIVYKCDSGYTHPNYMYRYEYNGATYLGEAGVHDTSKRIYLGDGWWWAWNTFTTLSTTTSLSGLAAFYYRYSTSYDKLSIAKVLLVKGDYTNTHPKYWPALNSTRSNTQALLDLTGNSTLTASSLTYANDGTFSFNGGTDSIYVPSIPQGSGSNFTVIAWVNSSAVSGAQNIVSMNGPYFMRITNSTVRFNVLAGGSWLFQQGTTILKNNTWYQLSMVYNYDASLWIGYINGNQEFSVSKSGVLANTNFYSYIGYTPQVGEQAPFNGKIQLVQFYNRTLSASEIASNYNSQKEKFFGYQAITYISSSNVTLTNNGTTAVTMFKTASNNSWDSHVYSADAFNAPCTIEFTKNAGTTDNGVSYAMIGWNADPTTDQSYSSLDYAAYPYRTDTYSVYHNGSKVLASKTWDPNQKFYIVYDTDGYIRHYNGSKLLYSVNKGTNQTVYVDSSFYSVNATYGGFTDVRVCRKSWNGLNYVG